MTGDLSARLQAFFEADGHGAVAYLFGSEARGVAVATSDVDVAVLFEQAPAPVLSGGALTLAGALERALGRRVDLVSLNTASADVVHRVLRDGVIVCDRDRSKRIRFEVAKRNEFFDLEPLRRRYRRAAAAASAAAR
jgi:predicted nucleotidyltransferase